MLKRFFLISLIILIRLSSFSQSKYIYYFDDNINLVKKSKAVLKGVGIYENGSLELNVFDKKSKLLLSIWHFTDSTLQVTNGLFVTYYNNKIKETEGSYLLGKKDGIWRKWNREGKLLDSSLFSNGEEISENIYSYYPDGKLMSEGAYSSKDNKVQRTFYDEKGNVITPTFKEDFDKIFTKTEVEASFPGGVAAWSRYISKVIESNVDEFEEEDYGTCIIRFIVDTAGNVHNVEAIKGCGEHLYRVGMEAIKNGPKWIPAQQNGRLVNAYKIQPITLQDPNK